MKRKKIIKLPNRDGFKIWLQKIKGTNNWRLCSGPESGLTSSPFWIRYLTDDDRKIVAIDPVGGPYIHLGFEIDGYSVTKIEGGEEFANPVLTLEHREN